MPVSEYLSEVASNDENSVCEVCEMTKYGRNFARTRSTEYKSTYSAPEESNSVCDHTKFEGFGSQVIDSQVIDEDEIDKNMDNNNDIVIF